MASQSRRSQHQRLHLWNRASSKNLKMLWIKRLRLKARHSGSGSSRFFQGLDHFSNMRRQINNVGTLKSLAGPIGRLNHHRPKTKAQPARNFPSHTGANNEATHTIGPDASSDKKMIATNKANDSMLYLCSALVKKKFQNFQIDLQKNIPQPPRTMSPIHGAVDCGNLPT